MQRPLLLLATTLLVGCPSDDAPTWHAEVQPLMGENCVGCHRDGGQAPFSLETIDDVRSWARPSLAAMEAGTMPPYKADPDCRTFEQENILETAEIDAFRAWIDAAMPEGDGAGVIPVEPPPLATIDPTHRASVPAYVSTAIDEDDYRCFVLDIPTDRTRYLRASEVVPGTPQVHHVLGYAMTAHEMTAIRDADGSDGRPGYTCFGTPTPETEGGAGLAGGFPNQIAAWVPGAGASVFPDDLGIRIERGGAIVMQVHYSAFGGDPEADGTELKVVLTDEAPAKLSSTGALAVRQLDIPAHEPNARFTSTFTNYGDEEVAVGSFTGHMHLLGTSISADLVRADGARECAVDIPDWDFDWQSSYKLPADEELIVRPGDSFELTCTYDNTAANQPTVDGVPVEPQDVAWGDGTLDEMCLLYFTRISETEPEPTGLPCEGSEACLASCGDDPTIDCLLTCEEVAPGCSTCLLGAGQSCGLGGCMLGLLSDPKCITDCALSALMLGGSVGECMTERCGEGYDAFTSCTEPTVAGGACDEAFAGCGVPMVR